MKKLKKRKLALVTAIATLTAGLSVFSGVPASAEAKMVADYVVIYADTSAGYALLLSEGRTYAKHYATPEAAASCCTSMLADPLAKQAIEQASYGDIIRFTGEALLSPCLDGCVNTLFRPYINENTEEDTFEIVGSVFDTPMENVIPVTIDGQTFLKFTLMDGTNYVIEDGISYEDMAKIASTGFDEEISLADMEFEGKDHCPIWVLPNEDGDVNSDDVVDSADAAVILEDVALNAVGDTGRMNASENQAADVNGDGVIDAQDAAVILSYSAEIGSGMLEGVTLKAYAAQ